MAAQGCERLQGAERGEPRHTLGSTTSPTPCNCVARTLVERLDATIPLRRSHSLLPALRRAVLLRFGDHVLEGGGAGS